MSQKTPILECLCIKVTNFDLVIVGETDGL